MTFYHLMNVRSPLDLSAQWLLTALGENYRLSLPIEADPAPGINPVPQTEMVKNGIIGVYATIEAASKPEMAPHIPMVENMTAYLEARPFLAL